MAKLLYGLIVGLSAKRTGLELINNQTIYPFDDYLYQRYQHNKIRLTLLYTHFSFT